MTTSQRTNSQSSQEALRSSSDDRGHRLGNFHNYYTFHGSTQDRVASMKPMLDYIVRMTAAAERNSSSSTVEMNSTRKITFRYCDLGCNEGDLTVAIATELERTFSHKEVKFVGVDIDPVLIQRANAKWSFSKIHTSVTTSTLVSSNGNFQVADMCDCEDLFSTMWNDDDNASSARRPSVDLISLLSTTMWLHVHLGDDDFRRVIQHICQQSRRFVLIEPQPSKCYRSATVRLRRLGRPELDVSNERLRLRADIETEIDTIVKSVGFRRVEDDLRLPLGANERRNATSAASWNRSMRLYERSLHDI